MRLRRFTVDGFKSLRDFSCPFPSKLLVLIGPNGSGKTSVLQALGFLRYYVDGRPTEFFEERGWTRSLVRSLFGKSTSWLGFKVVLEDDRYGTIEWAIRWGLQSGLSGREQVTVHRGPQLGDHVPDTMHYSREERTITIRGNPPVRGVKCEGSALAILELSDSTTGPYAEPLIALRDWARGIFSLELMNPASMRRGVRRERPDIGPQGDQLGSFLATLDTEAKSRVVERVAKFYEPLDSLDTIRKRAGWIDLKVGERYERSKASLGPKQLSDGFLRLLALASVCEFGPHISLVLLDEIEDGVEPHILPHFVNMLRSAAAAQFVITSHSPLLVNSCDPRDLRFLARKNDGRSVSAGFDELAGMDRHLRLRGPGEIWANARLDRINKLVIEAAEARAASAKQPTPSPRRARSR